MGLRLSSKVSVVAASLTIVFLTLFLAWMIVKPWVAQGVISKDPLKEELSRAVALDTRNHSHHYRTGFYWHYSSVKRDLGKARVSYINAIGLSPTNALYWRELAKVYADLGDGAASIRALERTIDLNPTDRKARWMMVNLRLRRTETDRALSELGTLIRDHPGERTKAFSLVYAITGRDIAQALRRALPQELKAMTGYLFFLMGQKDTAGVKALWGVLEGRFELDNSVRTKYVDYLIKAGEAGEARGLWLSHKGVKGDASNIVWNGGFEQEPGKGGFNWELGKGEGFHVDIDGSVSHGAERSLKVEFDGGHNVNFRHVRQIVPLEADTTYTLSARIKTDNITTTNGMFMEFYGINGCRFSERTEVLTGTNDWKPLKIELSTPRNCGAGVVMLRRVKSDKFNKRIGGRVWIDDVMLERFYANVH